MFSMDILHGNVLSHVSSFVDDESYIYIGSVSKEWKNQWINRPKKTTIITKYTSIKQLEFAFECNLRKTRFITQRSCMFLRHDLFLFAKTSGCPIGTSLTVAYRTGDIEMIKLVSMFSNTQESQEMYTRAFMFQHEHVFNWIYSIHGFPCMNFEFLFDICISHNNVIGMGWLLNQSHIDDNPVSIYGDHHPQIALEMLECLETYGIRLNKTQVKNISIHCAYSGNVNILSWMLSSGYCINVHLIQGPASVSGRTNVLEWIQSIINS